MGVRNEIERSEAARLFHALSDETRLEILQRLRSEEQCVCDLMGSLGAAQSRLSFHLQILKDAGILKDRRDRAPCGSACPHRSGEYRIVVTATVFLLNNSKGSGADRGGVTHLRLLAQRLRPSTSPCVAYPERNEVESKGSGRTVHCSGWGRRILASNVYSLSFNRHWLTAVNAICPAQEAEAVDADPLDHGTHATGGFYII